MGGAGWQANRLRLCCIITGGCLAVASRDLRGAPAPLSLNELSRLVSAETAEVSRQLMQRVSRLWGRGEGGGLFGKPCWPSLQEVQEGVFIVAGGAGAGLQANRTGFCLSTHWGESRMGQRKASHSLAAASPECTRWSRRQESWAMWITFLLSR